MSSTLLLQHPTNESTHSRRWHRSAWLAAAALCIGATSCASQAPQDARPPSADLASKPPAPPTAPAASSAAPALPSAEAPVAAPTPSASAPAGPPPVPGFVAIAETHKGKFPGRRPPKAKMFALKPAAEAGGDACAAVVGADGNLCARVVGPGAEINAVHIERVTDLLSDGRAFNSAAPKCFEPSHAIVFYDEKDVPMGWTQLSLSCSSLTARPALTGIPKKDDAYAVAGAAFAYLRGLCKTLKMGACEAAPPAGK